MIVLLIVFLCSTGLSQHVPMSDNFIEHLISAASDSKGKSLYRSMDSSSIATMWHKISVVDTISELSCQDICESFSKQQPMYDSIRIPPSISTIYDEASTYIANNRLRDAVKIFYVAYALKKDFIEREKIRLTNNYLLTAEFSRREAIDSVLFYAEQFEKENSNNSAYIIVEKEFGLRKFYEEMKKDALQLTNEKYYDLMHLDQFDNPFALGIGIAGILTSGRNNPSIRITNYQTFEETYKPGGDFHYSSLTAMPMIAISIPIFNQVSMCVKLSTQTFTKKHVSNNNESTEFTFYDSDHLRILSYQAEVLLKYVFRSKIGIRPFVESGIGINRNRAEGKKLLAIFRYTYYALEQSNISPITSLNIGFEYVYSKENPVFYSISFGGYYNPIKNDLIGTYSVQLSGMVHVIL